MPKLLQVLEVYNLISEKSQMRKELTNGERGFFERIERLYQSL
jgi:hypothetical protein